MALTKPVIYDGAFQRQIAQGDTYSTAQAIPATIATTAITVTGAMLAAGFILRSPAAPATDTIDTAANIVAALGSGIGNIGIQAGTSFRCQWIVTTANATTIAATANTGVTVTRGAIAASSGKEMLVTITNGTPAQNITANTTNASAVITGMTLEETSLLSVGMVVTNAVNGLQGTTIISVQPGTGVTMSGNANATSTNVAISFSPTVLVEGIGQTLI
jgi:hypothetical protein